MGKNEAKGKYRRRIITLFSVIILFIVGFFVLIYSKLNEKALETQKQNNLRYLRTTVATLDNNSEEYLELNKEFHREHKIAIQDLEEAMSDNILDYLLQSPTNSCSMLREATYALDDSAYFLVVDKEGKTLLSNVVENLGYEYVKEGDVSEENFKKLINGEISYVSIPNPYIEEGEDPDGEMFGKRLYLYSEPVRGSVTDGNGKYLIMSFGSKEVEKLAELINDYKAWLNDSSVGKGGVAILVDADDNLIKYAQINGDEYINVDVHSIGVTDECLADNYSGIQTIKGKRYYCSTVKYSSEIYHDNYLIAAVPCQEVFSGNVVVVLWSACLILMACVITLAFSSFIRTDLLKKKADLKKIKLFKMKGKNYYYSRAIARKVFPMSMIMVVCVLLATWYMSTLTGLSDIFTTSVNVQNDVSARLEDSESNRKMFDEYYHSRNLSKSKLLSFVTSLRGDRYLYYDTNSVDVNVHTRLDKDGDRVNVLDYYGNPLYSVANSSSLTALANNNEVMNILMFNEDGHVIATSDWEWGFSLSKEDDTQSYEFWNILDGKSSEIYQKPMINEKGKYTQYIASGMTYYTRQGEDGKTYYENYVNYLKQMRGEWLGGEITKHLGMIQVELQRDDVGKMVQSVKPQYIVQNTQVMNEGFLMGFEKDEDNYNIFFSPDDSVIGKNAIDIGINEKAFSGYYNGFQKINSRNCLMCCKEVGDYLIATCVPYEVVIRSGAGMAGMVAFYLIVMLLILSGFTVIIPDMEQDEKQREISDPLAVFGRFYEARRGHKKRTNMQMFVHLVKLAMVVLSVLLIVLVFVGSRQFSKDSALVYIIGGEWERGLHIFSISACIILIILAIIIVTMIERLYNSVMSSFSNRARTVGHLFFAVFKCAVYVGVLFFALYLMGLNTTTLFTSAGVLTAVVGIGAQSLIGDLLAGIFIVSEGSIHVGDWVKVGEFRGKVQQIGLRTTSLMDDNQNLMVVNNNELKQIINMSKELSYTFLNIPISYNEPPQRIRELMEKELPKISEKIPELKEPMQYKGINAWDDSSVAVMVAVLADENKRLQTVRTVREEIYKMFGENNIEIPFNQIDVHMKD